MTEQTTEQRAFDIPGFCEAYRVGRSTTYEEIRTGRLQIMKVGKLTRISSEAAENWRRDREKESALDPAPACVKAKIAAKASQAETALNGLGKAKAARVGAALW